MHYIDIRNLIGQYKLFSQLNSTCVFISICLTLTDVNNSYYPKCEMSYSISTILYS